MALNKIGAPAKVHSAKIESGKSNMTCNGPYYLALGICSLTSQQIPCLLIAKEGEQKHTTQTTSEVEMRASSIERPKQKQNSIRN